MRPLTLTMEGFGVFRERVEVDFSDVDYFALVGPTGAGKSTVIDAICFALYGSVPRHDRRAVAPVVSTGALEARVELVFDSIGVRHRVVRVARAKDGRATVKEARLEVLAADGTESLAGSVKELNDLIAARVVGLSYEEFCKCVVLPQGEFAAFLHDEPNRRQDLLVRLLGLGRYSSMASAAAAHATGADGDARVAQTGIDAVAGVTVDLVHDAERRATDLGEFSAACAALVPVDAEHRAAVAELADEVRRIDAVLRAVDEVRLPDDADALGAVLTLRRTELAAAESEAQHAKGAHESLAAKPVPDMAQLERALDAHVSYRDARAALDVARAAYAAPAALETEARAAHELAGSLLRDARRLFESVQLTHAPHALAAKLVVGEPCPVCEQPVGELPRAKELAELHAARDALDRAEAEQAAADREFRRATSATSAARGRVESDEERVEALATIVAKHADVTLVEAELVAAREQAAAFDAARAADHRASQTVASARAALDKAVSEVSAKRSRFVAQRDALVTAGAEPPPEADDLHESWRGLVQWAGAVRAQYVDLRRRRADEGRARRSSADAALIALREQAIALELAPGVADTESAAALDRVAAVSAHAAAADHERLGEQLLRAERLRTELADAQERASVARTLAGLLRADGFERWLLLVAMDDLVAAASVTLHSLSGGAYSLTHDANRGEFLVVDHHNADETRSVRSLSGGETFQASLALALALSEHLARGASGAGAAMLDAIFLDEGFGTLDPESLEVVAATVEHLASGERMVGIITHVRELAERVPVRYEVRKIGRTSTVTMAADA